MLLLQKLLVIFMAFLCLVFNISILHVKHILIHTNHIVSAEQPHVASGHHLERANLEQG